MDFGIGEAAAAAALAAGAPAAASSLVPATAGGLGSVGSGLLAGALGGPSQMAASSLPGLGMANMGIGLLNPQAPQAPVAPPRPPMAPPLTTSQILGPPGGSAAMVGNRMGQPNMDPRLLMLLMQQQGGMR